MRDKIIVIILLLHLKIINLLPKMDQEMLHYKKINNEILTYNKTARMKLN
jgi:hypothetical protein